MKSRLLQNVLTLYGVQACTYALPLLTLPFLARVLGPAGWGAVAFAQAIGAAIAIAVEYGFDFSATRETARQENNRENLAELVSGVLTAKILIALLCLIVAMIVREYTMHIARSAALFWASAVWGIAQGVNMLWYFQGLERMKLMGAIDIGGRILATATIFLLVRQPSDGWKVMAAQAFGCLVTHAITVWFAFREVGFRRPTYAFTWRALRLGWPMFIFKASQSLSVTANGLIIGALAPVSAVGMFTGADRITNVARQGLWPINQALFPRLSKQIQQRPNDAARTVRFSLIVISAVSVAVCAVLVVGAPVIVRMVLGNQYAAAASTLRILALTLPVFAFCVVLSFQWMLPLGLDRQFNVIVLTSGVLNVGLGVLLVPRLSHVGMALALLTQQVYSALALCWVLRAPNVNPFSAKTNVLETTPAEVC